MNKRTCRQCEAPLPDGAHRAKLYCSDVCKSWAAWLGPGRSKHCSECGARMMASKTSRPGPGRCAKCSEHGVGGYQRGCRCEVCSGAKNAYMRRFNASVKERDGVSATAQYKRRLRGVDPLETVLCAACDEPLSLLRSEKVDRPTHKACRVDSSFYVPPAVRLSVYERDEWTCTICDHPVDRDAHYLTDWSPTLDHVVPQAGQLVPDHSPSNLRLAHRYCNLARGARPIDLDSEVKGRALARRSKEVPV